MVTELTDNGGKSRTYAYAKGEVIGWQGEATQAVQWNIADPLTGTRLETSAGGHLDKQLEPDSQGVDVGLYDPNILAS